MKFQMKHYKIFPLIFLALISVHCFASAEQPLDATRAPLNSTQKKMLLILKSIVDQLSVSKKATINIKRGTPKVLEFNIDYPPEDEKAIVGMAGTTQTALQLLFNELSIASERDEVLAQDNEFKISERKNILLLHFRKKD